MIWCFKWDYLVLFKYDKLHSKKKSLILVII
jgi:hypothetical protein